MTQPEQEKLLVQKIATSPDSRDYDLLVLADYYSNFRVLKKGTLLREINADSMRKEKGIDQYEVLEVPSGIGSGSDEERAEIYYDSEIVLIQSALVTFITTSA